jgi:hypothetical protein
MEQSGSGEDTKNNIYGLDQNIQSFKESCGVNEPREPPPFYVVEKQELL